MAEDKRIGVRMIMLEAARRQKVKPDRISFVDALRWLMEFDGANKLGQLIVLPVRLGRSKPRIKKRHDRGYQFRFKTLREKKAEWKQLKQIYIDELKNRQKSNEDAGKIDDLKKSLGLDEEEGK